MQTFSVESLDNDESSEDALCYSRVKISQERLKNMELCELMLEEQHESVEMILLHFSMLQMAFRRNLNDSGILIAVSFIPRVTHAVESLQNLF